MKEIKIDLIDPNPYQLRTSYDDLKMMSLVESIQKYGLQQIPIARKVGNRYQLAFGHQRLDAFKILQRKKGYSTMPLKIETLDDNQMFELFVIENAQREDLSSIDKARILRKYMNEFGASSEQAGRLFGISSSYVRGLIRLLNAPEEIQEKLKKREIPQSEARHALAKITNQKHTVYRPKKEKVLGKTNGNLKLKLIKLVYGEYRSDVTDEMLYRTIKNVFEYAHIRNVSH